jgi:hypothetical protein
MDALLRRLDRVLAAGDADRDLIEMDRLCDPVSIERRWFGLTGSYDLSRVTLLKPKGNVARCPGVRKVQLPDAVCRMGTLYPENGLERSRDNLNILCALVFPPADFTCEDQLVQKSYPAKHVKDKRGKFVAILGAGYILEHGEGGEHFVTYMCSFQLRGSLECQFHSICYMAYALCSAFVELCDREINYFSSKTGGRFGSWRSTDEVELPTPEDYLAAREQTQAIRQRTDSLRGKMRRYWPRAKCLYALDDEDYRLLDALDTVVNVKVGHVWNSTPPPEQLTRFTAAKLEAVRRMMTVIYNTFCSPGLFEGTLSNSQMQIKVDTQWCEVTWKLVNGPGAPKVEYTARYGRGSLHPYKTVEHLLASMLNLMNRWELGCYFKDRPMATRMTGDSVERGDSPAVSGPQVHDPDDTWLRPGGPEFTGPTETVHRESYGPDWRSDPVSDGLRS